MQQCLYCGKDVPQQLGKRKREYCDNVCKQQAYRKRHSDQSTRPELVVLPVQSVQENADVEELVRLRALAEEQATEIYRLRRALDVERRYLVDVTQHSFKAFLKKMRVKSPLAVKLIDDKFFMPRDTRVHYEYHLHRLKYSSEEIEEFTRLWKLMLLES